MELKELAVLISAFERAGKKLITEETMLGSTKREIKAKVKLLIHRLTAKKQVEKETLDALARSARVWMAAAKPLAGEAQKLLVQAKKPSRQPGLSELATSRIVARRHTPAGREHQLEQLRNTISKAEHLTLGFNQAPDCYRRIQQTMKKLSSLPPTAKPVKGVQRLSLFHRAEVEARHEIQTGMLQRAHDSNNRLFWISAHADCSKRCQSWQGKLIDLDAPAIDHDFKTGEVVEGHTVYSLSAIMAQTDKYGYHNNIICGFNCRHHLIPWRPQSHAQRDYTDVQTADLRKMTAKKRVMEVKIRKLRALAEMQSSLDSRAAKKTRSDIRRRIADYDSYTHGHNLVCEHWRF